MRFDELLRAHGFMRVERPPLIWEAETEDVRFLPLLGEMIAAVLSRGAVLSETTLNVSNVDVETDEDAEPEHRHGPFPGEYVAVTVSGTADLGPDGVWHPEGPATSALLRQLTERLTTAGARYAYIRRIPPVGSMTVFLTRLVETPEGKNA